VQKKSSFEPESKNALPKTMRLHKNQKKKHHRALYVITWKITASQWP
jgi:hypothetical protein